MGVTPTLFARFCLSMHEAEDAAKDAFTILDNHEWCIKKKKERDATLIYTLASASALFM